MKLLRAIFRRFGYALIPLNAMEKKAVRIEIFKALFAQSAKDRLRHGVATYDDMADAAELMEAQEAEITRLRAAINDALLEPWLDGQLNGTWHQEPIGPNETPEEAVKRLVSVRAEWAVYKNNCENPVIAELRAALATARREGMEEAAKWHDEQAAQAQKLSDMKVSALDAKVWGDYAANHREYAAAIRAAAKEGK